MSRTQRDNSRSLRHLDDSSCVSQNHHVSLKIKTHCQHPFSDLVCPIFQWFWFKFLFFWDMMCTIICNTLCNSFWRMTVVIVLLSYHLLWLCWIEWFWVLGWLFNNKAICPRIALMNFNLNWDHAVTDSKVITRSQAKEQKSKLSPRTSSFSTEKWESKSVDCNAVCCSMLQCEPSSSSFIICFRVWWNVVQCGARWVMVFHSHHVWWSMLDLLQRVVVCSSVLQCAAVCCSVLQSLVA